MTVIIVDVNAKREEPDLKLEELIKEEFESIKTSFFRPPIFGPEILYKGEDNINSTAFLNWLNLNISLFPKFLKEVSKDKDLKKSLRGLLSHEFGHYFFHPADLKMQLYLSFMASKTFKEEAYSIYGFFTDFQNNILIHNNEFNQPDMEEFLRGAASLQNGPFYDAINSVYNDKDKLNLGIRFDFSKYTPDEKKAIETGIEDLKKVIIRQVDVSSTIDYQIQYSQLLRFGDAVKPLLKLQREYDNKNGKEDEGGDTPGNLGKGNNENSPGMPSTGPKIITKEDFDKLSDEQKQKMQDEMKQLIKSLPKEQYDELKKHFLGKSENQQHGIGIGFGTAETGEATKENVDYYRDAAKVYGFYIRPKRVLGVSSIKINFGRKDFKPSDKPLDMDLRFSGGKILPGLSKVVRMETIPFPKTNDFTPRALIYKDVSGSMVNPMHDKCYGTIASVIIALSYLRSEAEVGVVLFDSSSDEAKFSRKENEIIKLLSSYKGGGTHVDMEQLIKDLEKNTGVFSIDKNISQEELKNNPFFKKYLEMMKHNPKYTQKQANITGLNKIKKEATTDFYIVTDGGIGNVDDLLQFFSENPGYRSTIIHTGAFHINIPGYDQQTSGTYSGIAIFKANSDDDIISMTKDSLKKNLLS